MVGGTIIPPGKDDTVLTQVLKWAAGQPFNNVLLLAIFASICWIAHFAITVAIPKHLRQIQDGYEKIDEGHERGRQRDIEIYDRWFNRMEERLNNGGVIKSGGTEADRPNLGEMRSRSKRLPQAEGIALVQPIGYQVSWETAGGNILSWEVPKNDRGLHSIFTTDRYRIGGSGLLVGPTGRCDTEFNHQGNTSSPTFGRVSGLHRELKSRSDPESRIIWRPIEAESGGGSDF